VTIVKKILTIIFDGFGHRDETHGNAIASAEMPNFNYLWENYPHSILEASEEAVGLKKGQFGNSEVGHMTIGAGRLIKQNEIIVNDFLAEDYKTNELFQEFLENNKEKRIHLMGLASDGNVHAGIDDFLNLYKILVNNGFKNIYFHLITDGRDTEPHQALKFINMVQDAINENKVGSIATICGRYYAMDRDQKYERTQVYYDLVTKGRGVNILSIQKALDSSYEKNITDEFLRPLLVDSKGLIQENDVLFWLNYRADRAKQILSSLTNLEFDSFPIKQMPNLKLYSFFPIDTKINSHNFIEATHVENALGIYLSKLGFTQARVAESEKYPHVTYFFDGGFNGKIPECDKFEIPSPKVLTYDLQPEMSALGVTKKVIKCMEEDYDFILVNFANPDMVGHTGNFNATVKACETIDHCLKELIDCADENFYKIILLADHGNSDTMLDENNLPCTTHSIEPVPFIIRDNKVELKDHGDLTMVAPTILTYMDIALPKEMENTEVLIK
jgi:2,3-bisphosphoglycerate-independent phosphoglycerate mutase